MATALGIKAKDTFAIFSLLGLLVVGAAFNTVKAENLPEQSTVQVVISLDEHSVLAKRFEDTAREMQAKADEQKKLLEQYEEMHLYGWQSHNLKSHASALIRKYEQAARSNMKEAVAHRQMAQRQFGSNVIHGGETPQTGSN
ncbi:hypothetical protein [Nitrosospira sp. NpAV]|uniref:hypothetical protein n=1 Tax=Nitrosospira sp. NpAV TaxID=58133 RepID=UPI0006973BD0|nr:hypothetical protein [Nitrosospira sp. NpAV]